MVDGVNLEIFLLSDHADVVEGLRRMMQERFGDEYDEYARMWVPMGRALLIVAVARRVEDKPEYFPRGKWATIQAIEQGVDWVIDRALKGQGNESRPT